MPRAVRGAGAPTVNAASRGLTLALPRPRTPQPIRRAVHLRTPTAQHLARTGTWYLPARDRRDGRAAVLMLAPPRPAHKRPTPRITHRIARCGLGASRTRSPHRPRPAASLLLGRAPDPRVPRSRHPRRIPASTGTCCLPVRALRTARAAPLRVLAPHPRASLTESPRIGRLGASPYALPAPPALRRSSYLHPRASARSRCPPRTCTPEGRARTSYRGRLALTLAPPAAAASSTEGAKRGALTLTLLAALALGRHARHVCASRRSCRGGHGTRSVVRQRREGSVESVRVAEASTGRDLWSGTTTRWDIRRKGGKGRERERTQNPRYPILVQRNHPLQALELVVRQSRTGTDDHIRNGAAEHDALASGVYAGVAGISAGVQGVELAGGDDDDDEWVFMRGKQKNDLISPISRPFPYAAISFGYNLGLEGIENGSVVDGPQLHHINNNVTAYEEPI
ncbi:hypothetical protein DFH09DRAFT_1418481 [Mycena vulgaris]|nr:hypothetical protein DFH09DRAFT_1418481 [Mycena vulgaris]